MTLSEDVVQKYLSRRTGDLEACRAALGTQNFAPIERIGHILKGNGVTFGFPELSILGEQLESAAIRKDLEVLQILVKEFADWTRVHVQTDIAPDAHLA